MMIVWFRKSDRTCCQLFLILLLRTFTITYINIQIHKIECCNGFVSENYICCSNFKTKINKICKVHKFRPLYLTEKPVFRTFIYDIETF